MSTLEPPVQPEPDRSSSSVATVAEQIADAAESTGVGFLLARIVVDRILDGSLDPSSPEFVPALYGQATELLIDPANETTDRALLTAASVVSDRGVPLGQVWETAARAIDGAAAPTLEAQLGLVARLARFFVEDQWHGETVYRPFHPALQERLSDDFLSWNEPSTMPTSERRERITPVLHALVDLRAIHRAAEAAGERASPFLRNELPRLLARTAGLDLLSESVDQAPPEDRELLGQELLAVAEDARAVGDLDYALDRAQWGVLLAGQLDAPVALDLRISQSAVLRAQDDWRNARDVARAAEGIADHLIEADPTDHALIAGRIRATVAHAAALGVGAFDAGIGKARVDATLEWLAGLPPELLDEAAAAVAELLGTYTEYLQQITPAPQRLHAARGARIVLERLLDAGRTELGPELSLARGLEGVGLLDLGDREGFRLLRESADGRLGGAAISVRGVLGALPFVGELVQRLGVAGEHDEAAEWVERALTVYRSQLPSETARLAVRVTSMMGSAVEAVRGNADRAMDHALEAAELDPVGAVLPLAIRLVDAGRWAEVAKLPTVEQWGPSWWAEEAQIRELLAAGESERADEQARALLTGVTRATIPGRGITFGEFIDFEPELRCALLVQETAEAAGRSSADEMLAGAAALLHRVAGRPCRQLLHVHPEVLARFTDVLPDALDPARADHDDWHACLRELAANGRDGLLAWLDDRPWSWGMPRPPDDGERAPEDPWTSIVDEVVERVVAAVPGIVATA